MNAKSCLPVAVTALVLAVSLAGPSARAQDPDEWSVQKFRPAIHSLGAFSTEAARVSHEFTINAFLMANYAVGLMQDRADEDVVESLATFDLVASAGFLDHLSFGVDVPVHALSSGIFLDGDDLPDAGIGDIRLSLKGTLLKPMERGPGIGLGLDVHVPSGSKGGYTRDHDVVVVPKILLDVITRHVHLMTNIFFYARSGGFDAQSQVQPGVDLRFGDNLKIDSEAGASIALAIFLGSPDADTRLAPLRMVIEGRFESVLTRFFEPENTQLEFSLGFHWRSKNGFAVGGGASAGVLEGYGDPLVRGFLTVGYQPGKLIPMPEENTDKDGDGILDREDQCPSDPEDKDEFEDADGCPEDDNDKDGIKDVNDKCPLEPEDKDGDRDDDGCPDGDKDGDGIADDLDQCPTQPEDKDNFEDSDGCPDTDNDKDGIPDNVDACPDKPEDVDGDRDTDGCPDGDGDKDGIADDVDKCPTQPEDVDGFQDDDGCPDPDNDGDGILDGKDKCPVDAEDKDGFKDEDGCPEPDNDGDGILDVNDKCPDKAEDIDGCQDEDGCPEEGRVCVSKEKITISEKIFFKTGKADILPKSYSLLAEIAKVMNENPQIKLIEIQGHTDSQGPDDFNMTLSDARANSVMTHLVTIGSVDPKRLTAKGYGEDVPIGDNKTAKGRELNRRVEFMILKQDQ
ncbi:MAG: OmpA family protein [Deltaproteobacteria bacterium]|nr:OmpA family protein [Deltaproteobacteria bacterium]